jgi:hypothetical protein
MRNGVGVEWTSFKALSSLPLEMSEENYGNLSDRTARASIET